MKEPQDRTKFWRYLTDFWTIVAFVVIGLNFKEAGHLHNLLGPVLAIYVGLLAIFLAEKEFERWHWKTGGKHMGELYVWIWTALIVGILAITYFTHSEYVLEEEIWGTYIAVLAVLAITRKSKEMFSELVEKSKGIEDNK